MTYRFKPGRFVPKNVSATVVARTLNDINKRYGKITGELYVETLEPEEHPAHDSLTWDNNECGPKWRLHEARNIIRSVVVIQSPGAEPEPAYVRVIQEDDSGVGRSVYRPVSVAVHIASEWSSAVQMLADKVQQALIALEALNKIAADRGLQNKESLREVSRALSAAHAALDALT